MSTARVLESLWQALVKRMPQSEATEILNDVRDSVLRPIKNRELHAVHREVANCRACDKFNYLNNVALWNTDNPQILVVLERPQIGRPASDLLTEALAAAGFDKSNAALTYLNRCLPLEGGLNEIHRANCLGYLEEEIWAMQPKIVIACGKPVAQALIGPITQVSKMRGEIYWAGNFAVMVTFSPLYVVSDKSPKSLQQTFFDDIQTAAKLHTKDRT